MKNVKRQVWAPVLNSLNAVNSIHSFSIHSLVIDKIDEHVECLVVNIVENEVLTLIQQRIKNQ